VKGEQAGVRRQLLVEEVLQLEGPTALGGVGGIEGGIRMALLERGDDRGGVADGLPVEPQDRKRAAAAPRQGERDDHVDTGHRRPALMLDALVIERPADLLAVVRDRDVPEHRLRRHWIVLRAHCAAISHQ
jgi:hypothetical protein